jgi:ankyrin repeat protein
MKIIQKFKNNTYVYINLIGALLLAHVVISCECRSQKATGGKKAIEKDSKIDTEEQNDNEPPLLQLTSDKTMLQGSDKEFKLSLKSTTQTPADLTEYKLKISLQEPGSGVILHYISAAGITQNAIPIDQFLTYFATHQVLNQSDPSLILPFVIDITNDVTKVVLPIELYYKDTKYPPQIVTIRWEKNPITNEMITAAQKADKLFLAAILKKLQAGERIDINGLDPSDKNYTALEEAAILGDIAVVNALLDREAQANMPDPDGFTALHLAARDGHTEIILKLIEKGVPIDVTNVRGNTPLHLAAMFGQTETALKLIEKGANVHARNKDLLTAFHYATFGGHTETALKFIELGVPIGVTDKDGVTPLHYAIRQGKSETALRLLEQGAPVDVTDERGNSPLHYATSPLTTRKDYPEIALKLIEKGGQVNVINNKGNSPLHLATYSHQTQVVKKLIHAGAKLDSKDNAGDTPLHYAAIQGHTDIAKTLIKAGAKKGNIQQ